jgi:hypothetical protein
MWILHCDPHTMVKNTDSGKHEKIIAEEFKRRQGYDMIEK